MSRKSIQQKSPIIPGSHLPWQLLSIFVMSWWNLSPCSSLTTPRFGGKNLRWEWRKWILSNILVQTDLNASHALSSSKLRSSSKSVSFRTSRIWGPTKMPSELSSTKTCEHSRQVLEGSSIFVQRLQIILHQTKLDVKRKMKHLIHVHQRILLEAVFARNKSASRRPVFLLVMLGYSSTITETEKTTVLCEARLHTHKKTNDLICSNSWNWWSLHLPGLGSTV